MMHGGPDALGAPAHDFSTNANACGPCPEALAQVQAADATRYPDPAYTALRARLAHFHGVDAERIVIAASASEFIHRISAWAARRGVRAASLPAHGYGDYARAAQAWGLAPWPRGAGAAVLDSSARGTETAISVPSPQWQEGRAGERPPALHWACEPSSPLGSADALLDAPLGAGITVIDCAYAALRLHGAPRALPPGAWQLWSPNKALGLTGVRAAYALAPSADDAAALGACAPSWPTGAHGVALLAAWAQPGVQQWLAASLPTLRDWKTRHMALCAALGWQVLAGSLANFFVARVGQDAAPCVAALRAHGVKLRDCASFGLPGHVRLGVLPPVSQAALRFAVSHTIKELS